MGESKVTSNGNYSLHGFGWIWPHQTHCVKWKCKEPFSLTGSRNKLHLWLWGRGSEPLGLSHQMDHLLSRHLLNTHLIIKWLHSQSNSYLFKYLKCVFILSYGLLFFLKTIILSLQVINGSFKILSVSPKGSKNPLYYLKYLFLYWIVYSWCTLRNKIQQNLLRNKHHKYLYLEKNSEQVLAFFCYSCEGRGLSSLGMSELGHTQVSSTSPFPKLIRSLALCSPHWEKLTEVGFLFFRSCFEFK